MSSSSSWKNAVNAIIRGDAQGYRNVRLCGVPELLTKYGLLSTYINMTPGKIAKCRREHPEVSLETWYNLPTLICNPDAIFPSYKSDGSLIIVIAAFDSKNCPIIVPIIPDENAKKNIILSVYGKEDKDSQSAQEWINSQIAIARKANIPVFEKNGPVDSKPKPESADAISWSSDPISVDRSTEPSRKILTISKKSINK